VDFFNAEHCKSPLSFLLHNGDIIDYKNAFDLDNDCALDEEISRSALSSVLGILDRATCHPWLFTIGNHEMYNFTRDKLREGVKCEGIGLEFSCANQKGQFYHSFSPHPAWKVVILDSYDVSIYRKGRGQGLDAEALAELCRHNPNVRDYVEENPDVLQTEKMSGGFPYFKGLSGKSMRWVPFNGGVGAVQLEWLRQELTAAQRAGQRVIVFTHLLLHPEASVLGGKTLLWNYEQVLDLLAACGGSVSAVISGHQHEGGNFTDPDTGIHHIAMQSPLLADPGHRGPFALLEATSECLTLSGYGDCQLPSNPATPGAAIPIKHSSLSLRPLSLTDAKEPQQA